MREFPELFLLLYWFSMVPNHFLQFVFIYFATQNRCLPFCQTKWCSSTRRIFYHVATKLMCTMHVSNGGAFVLFVSFFSNDIKADLIECIFLSLFFSLSIVWYSFNSKMLSSSFTIANCEKCAWYNIGCSRRRLILFVNLVQMIKDTVKHGNYTQNAYWCVWIFVTILYVIQYKQWRVVNSKLGWEGEKETVKEKHANRKRFQFMWYCITQSTQ